MCLHKLIWCGIAESEDNSKSAGPSKVLEKDSWFSKEKGAADEDVEDVEDQTAPTNANKGSHSAKSSEGDEGEREESAKPSSVEKKNNSESEESNTEGVHLESTNTWVCA